MHGNHDRESLTGTLATILSFGNLDEGLGWLQRLSSLHNPTSYYKQFPNQFELLTVKVTKHWTDGRSAIHVMRTCVDSVSSFTAGTHPRQYQRNLVPWMVPSLPCTLRTMCRESLPGTRQRGVSTAGLFKFHICQVLNYLKRTAL